MKEYEEKICNFKDYAKQALDLMVDSYKWKVMAEHCDNETMKTKYLSISNTCYELFMKEHAEISRMFKQN